MRAACLPFLIIAISMISGPSESSAQWIRATGPTHGSVIALIVKGETLVAGTGAGLFRFTRTGSAWNVVDPALMQTNLTRVIEGMTCIFAGTSGHGVFLSSETGKTWTPSDTGLTDASIYSLAACGTEVFASARSRGFLSTDNGSHWTGTPPWDPRYAPYGILTPVAYAPQYPETDIRALLGGTQSDGVFLSTDDGRSWTAVNNGFPPPVALYEIGYPGISSLAFAGTSLIAGLTRGCIFPLMSAGIGRPAIAVGFWEGQRAMLAGTQTCLPGLSTAYFTLQTEGEPGGKPIQACRALGLPLLPFSGQIFTLGYLKTESGGALFPKWLPL